MTTLAATLIFGQVALAPNLVPCPVSILTHPGTFSLDRKTRIATLGPTNELGDRLRTYLSPATGYRLESAGHAGHDTIALIIDHRLTELGPEGYRLTVLPDRVEIRGFGEAGVFYGIQTLRQLFSADIFRKATLADATWPIPCLEIQDKPRFGWRGAHMDVARHFMPKEFVLKFLDLMALHKLNTFHWHLTDDNGWRIEIKRYPKLTSLASDSDYSKMNPENATRSINQRSGGFYSQDDVREVVKYAAERFITVVPEIELPGHSNAAIVAYPELGNRNQIESSGQDAKFMGSYDNVYNVDDSTITFLKGVLDEVLGLFPSKFIHIGGDEVDKTPWQKNPVAQARKKALNLGSEDELQSWFVRQFDSYLTQKGRHTIGWDEILEGGLAPGAAVMSWRGIQGGVAAAKAGHDVVMAPTDFTYLDYYQSRDTKAEPKAIGGYLPLSTVYGYEPIPKDLSPEEAKHVLGAQAQLWSEFIPHPKHMEYMAYPRLCALAELTWSPKELKSYADFLRRLTPHLERLKVLDMNFRPLDKGSSVETRQTNR